MRRMVTSAMLPVVLVSCLVWPLSAKAGFYEDVAFGLDRLGFQLGVRENPVGGGFDAIITRTFNNETLDFGVTELTVNGTLAFNFSTAGRGLQITEVSFDALGPGNNPFSYQLVIDTGNQLTTVNGTMLTNFAASLNSFGFYDLEYSASSRQAIEQEGRWSNEEFEKDFDIGPVDLRGNLLADLLATVSDPIFDALGLENVFASFSGAAQFPDSLNSAAQKAAAKARAGEPLSAQEMAELAAASALGGALGAGLPDFSFFGDFPLDVAFGDDAAIRGARLEAVPEPSCLLLVALGAPALLRRRLTKRR